MCLIFSLELLFMIGKRWHTRSMYLISRWIKELTIFFSYISSTALWYVSLRTNMSLVILIWTIFASTYFFRILNMTWLQEIITGAGHSSAIDWWALGKTLYFCMFMWDVCVICVFSSLGAWRLLQSLKWQSNDVTKLLSLNCYCNVLQFLMLTHVC